MSRQTAINQMCRQCIYAPKATGLGGWRDQVEACTSCACPLYPYRPVTEATRKANATPDPAAVARGQALAARVAKMRAEGKL